MKELRDALEGVKLAPKAVVGRARLYFRQLESFQRQGYSTVSSNQLGEPLSIKNAQVRKDLAFFGQFGHPGIGYRIDELISALRQILGIDRDWSIVLVGLGNAQDQSGPLVRARRGGSAGGRSDDRQWDHGNTQLRSGAAHGPPRHQRRGRGSERSAREPCVQGPEDPNRRFLRRVVFPLEHRVAKLQARLPGGETVSQQVLVLFFQVRILAG